MRLALLLLSIVVAVFARPEAGYPSAQIQPSGSYLPSHISDTYGRPEITGIDDGFNHNFNQNFHQDQKHVYFYAAPDDEQQSRFRIYVQPTSRRNTRIIFVKAPSYGGVIPEIISPPSQAEDKTLIYVLARRPQNGGAITIPAGLGVKQSKPEVHFIRYHSNHDAERAVSQGLHGGRVGTILTDLHDQRTFINHLGSRTNIAVDPPFTGTGPSTTNIAIDPPFTGINPRYGTPHGSGPY